MRGYILTAARRVLISILTVMLISAVPLFSAEFTSVPLGHPTYQLLESAQIRGIIERLPSTKPYSRRTVTEALETIRDSQRLSPAEYRVVDQQLRNLSGSSQGGVFSDGALYHSSEHLDAAMGASVASETSAGISSGPDNLSSTNFLNLYLSGDFKQDEPVLSYRFDMGFGTVGVFEHSGSGSRLEHKAASSYAPYTFGKVWEGYTYSLLDPFNFDSGSSQDMELDIAFSMDPEIAVGLFDENLRISFSRIPRNWGLGEDSLMLSGSANPFVSASVEAKIFEWMDYAFLFGSLENYGSKDHGRENQALITLHSVDVRPFDWLYLGVHEAVVWPKRFELGYLNPMIFSSLYQGMIGDFDNILGGLSLGFSLPGYAEMYGSFFFDEFRPSSFADLSERVRNFFSYKAGIQVHLPTIPFGTLRAQYTKIEPFTYTHPVTDVPWIDQDVHESFVTNGDGLVSKLNPNSDELLVTAKAFVAPSVQIRASYQMIRHGEYGGDYNRPLDGYSNGDDENGILPDGMDYADQFGGNDSPDVESIEGLRKDFLRDGDYDWFHIFALGGSYDLGEKTSLPLRIKLSNSVVYHFRTDENVERIESESTEWTNYLTVSIQLWGE
jgi:hypothetical protein